MPAISRCSQLKIIHNYEYVKFTFVKDLKERSAADFETAPLSIWRFSRRLGVFSADIPFVSHPCGAHIASRRKVCLSKSGAKVLLFFGSKKENQKKVAKTCCKTYFCIKKGDLHPLFSVFARCVVCFDRLGGDSASGVAALKITTFCSNSARNIARIKKNASTYKQA